MAVPLHIVEEVEALQSTYGVQDVRLHGRGWKEIEPDGLIATLLELDVCPSSAEADDVTLVWVTLLATLPPGYPLEAVPAIEVYRSRGIADAQVEAVLEAASSAVKLNGLNEVGCLLQIMSNVAVSLSMSASECCICFEPCPASEAINAPCGDVFHESCLKQWADLKKQERVKKADEATVPVVNQRDALKREVEQAEEREEEAKGEVKNHEYQVQEAEDWLVKMQKKAHAAMGDAESDDEESADEGEASDEDESGDSGEEGRDGRHTKIKFNNTGWGEGNKKNYKPSTTRNKKRAKKYLNKVEDKVSEEKERLRNEMRDKAQAEVSAWENAALDLKEAKALLDKARSDEAKAHAKTLELQQEWEGLGQELESRRDEIVKVPIPCPVCTNPLDPDGIMPELPKKEDAQDLENEGGAERKRRAAEAATGRVDIRLEFERGVESDEATLPKDSSRLIGVYVRDDPPEEGFPDGRPTYTGPKGFKLQYLHSQRRWVIGLGRLTKFFLEDQAVTPDYASASSAWQVATADGWREVKGLVAVCVNAQRLGVQGKQTSAEAGVREGAPADTACDKDPEEAQKESPDGRKKGRDPAKKGAEEPGLEDLERSPSRAKKKDSKAPCEEGAGEVQDQKPARAKSSASGVEGGTKKVASGKRPTKAKKKTLADADLLQVVSELVDTFEGDDEQLMETLKEVMDQIDGDARAGLIAAVTQLMGSPKKGKSKSKEPKA